MTVMTNKWLSYTDEKMMVETVFPDFNAAFDNVIKTIANKCNCIWDLAQKQLMG